MRRASKFELTADERFALDELATGDPDAQPIALRARIVLEASTGRPAREIAVELGTLSRTVARWRIRFIKSRMNGIRNERIAKGRKPIARWKHAARILEVTQKVDPPDGRRWSCRGLAAHLGVSPSLVQRVWKSAGIAFKWRCENASLPPFREGDRVLLLGGYFSANVRLVVAEVFTPGEEGIRDRHVEPIVELLSKSDMESATGRTRRNRHDQLLAFLSKIQCRAAASSALRILIGSDCGLSHTRLRRWLRRSGRFSIHSSSSICDYLNEAELELRSLVSQRFGRVFNANLGMLMEPRPRQGELSLDGAFDLAGLGLSSFASPSVS